MQNRLYFNLNQISSIDKRWIFKEIEREKPKIGYYSLPESNISEIIDFEQSVGSSIKNIIVIGIGGSSLGSRAVYEFIKPIKSLIETLRLF